MDIQQVKELFPEIAIEIERLESGGFPARTYAWIDALDTHQGQTACWLLGKVGNAADADLLILVLQEGKEKLWRDSATALSAIATHRHLPALISIMTEATYPLQRECAAYAIAFLTVEEISPEAINALVEVATNQTELPSIRAQAIEGLGNKLGVNCPKQLYQKGIACLIDSLDDNNPEIRFWACCALGAVREVAALPKLQLLAEQDTATIPGWWSVAEEAQDAIAIINGGTPRLR